MFTLQPLFQIFGHSLGTYSTNTPFPVPPLHPPCRHREHTSAMALQLQAASRRAQSDSGRQGAMDRLLEGASPSALEAAAAAGIAVSHSSYTRHHSMSSNSSQQQACPQDLQGALSLQQHRQQQHHQWQQQQHQNQQLLHQLPPVSARELRELEAKKRQDAIARLLTTTPLMPSSLNPPPHPTFSTPPSVAISPSFSRAEQNSDHLSPQLLSSQSSARMAQLRGDSTPYQFSNAGTQEGQHVGVCPQLPMLPSPPASQHLPHLQHVSDGAFQPPLTATSHHLAPSTADHHGGGSDQSLLEAGELLGAIQLRQQLQRLKHDETLT